jgi:hypothetical protein
MAAWLTLPSPLTHQIRSEEEKHAQDDRERQAALVAAWSAGTSLIFSLVVVASGHIVTYDLQWKKERMRRLKRKR